MYEINIAKKEDNVIEAKSESEEEKTFHAHD